MDLSKIIAVSGKAGLSKVISQTKSAFVAESLIDKKRFPVFPTQRISVLEEVSMYTEEGDTPLKNVFVSIFNHFNQQKVELDFNSSQDTTAFMDKVLPNWDKEQVKNTDIKKLVQWYNLLLEHELIDGNEEIAEAEEKAE